MKFMIITGSNKNMLAVYKIPQYACSKYLSVGCPDDDASAYTGCAANAVDDNGKCRCKVGFYDNLYGTCV
jgi:hypothetical protein